MAVAMTCAQECRMRSSSVIFCRSSSVLRSGCWFGSSIYVEGQYNNAAVETRGNSGFEIPILTFAASAKDSAYSAVKTSGSNAEHAESFAEVAERGERTSGQ